MIFPDFTREAGQPITEVGSIRDEWRSGQGQIEESAFLLFKRGPAVVMNQVLVHVCEILLSATEVQSTGQGSGHVRVCMHTIKEAVDILEDPILITEYIVVMSCRHRAYEDG